MNRIGVVVPIPEPRADRLRAARRLAGDALATLDPHLTLLTGVEVSDWHAALEQVHSVAATAAPFNLLLQGTDSFRPLSPVVYVPVVEGQEHCLSLHSALNSGVLRHEPKFEFVPHVTLAQNVPDDSLNLTQVTHAAERWWLFVDCLAVYGCSAESGEWHLLETLPLQG